MLVRGIDGGALWQLETEMALLLYVTGLLQTPIERKKDKSCESERPGEHAMLSLE